jgi:L-asparagine oxygenase
MSDISPTQISLTHEEQDAFRVLAKELTNYNPVTETEEYVVAAQVHSAQLPERIRRAALNFRRNGDASGGMLIRNLPVDPVPPTPDHADYGMGIHLPAAHVFSLAAALFGDQFGFRPELAGQIIQDILPVAGFEDTQQSISSGTLLELHCETVFTDYRADVIGLLCLRPDPEGIAGTVLASTGMVLPKLDASVIRTLSEPRFSTTVDGSFLRGAGIDHPILIGPIRVLDGDPLRPRIRCDFAETKGLDPEAQAALDTLYTTACESIIEVRLEAGDLLLVDNHDSFHGRTSFRRHGNGADRWLLRTFITRDMSRSRVHRPGDGRIVDTDYTRGTDVMPYNRPIDEGAGTNVLALQR